jgi:hypothetical protein
MQNSPEASFPQVEKPVANSNRAKTGKEGRKNDG